MNHRTTGIFLFLSSVIIVCWLLRLLQVVFIPLVMAIFISILLSPLVARLTRLRLPHVLAVTLAIFVAVAVTYLGAMFIFKNLASFQGEFPRYETRIKNMISKAKALSKLEVGPINQETVRAEINRLSLSGIVGGVLNSALSFFTYLLFTIIFALYFLLGSRSFPHKVRRAFPPDRAEAVIQSLRDITHQVQRYILLKTLTSILTGGCMLVLCLAFGIDFAVTWSFFAILLNFIPTIGMFIAGLAPPVMALIQYGSWSMVFWIVVISLVIFMTLGNFLEPKVLGESVNLSPLVALLSLLFWGWLWGPAGMFVAIPVTALIKSTCDHVEGLRPIGVLMGREV